MAAQVTTHTTLLLRLRGGGDHDAWREFSDRYSALIRGVAVKSGLQPADADDVVQDVLIGLTRAMPSYRYDPARAKFRTFLKRIVLRTVYRRFRQNRGPAGIERVEAVSPVGSIAAAAEDIWEAEWRQYHLHRAMRRIEVEFNDADREAFAWYVGEGRPARQTAEALGMTVDQVYQAKSRMLKRLAEAIAEQVEEEG